MIYIRVSVELHAYKSILLNTTFFRPGTSAKLRLLVQHDINTLRGQEKHGLQPALLVHWAKCLQKTVSSLKWKQFLRTLLSFFKITDFTLKAFQF